MSAKSTKENKKYIGAKYESKQIKKHADQWCRDNGYPIQKRYFVYRSKQP